MRRSGRLIFFLRRFDRGIQGRQDGVGDLARGLVGGIQPNRPRNRRETPKPGSLLLSVSAGPDLDAFDGGFERATSLEVIEEFPITDRFAGLGSEAALGLEAVDFVEESRIEHRLHAGVDPLVELVDGAIKDDQGRGTP